MKVNTETVGPVQATGKTITNKVPPLFKGTVIIRVKEQKFGPSSGSGLNQVTLVTEIIQPQDWVSDYDGNTYDLTSVPPKIYLPFTQVDKKGRPTDHYNYYVNELLPKLGLEPEFDDENPLETLKFEGLLIEVYLTSREKTETRQLPDGGYEKILDSRGEPVKLGYEWNMVDKTHIIGLGNIASAVEAAANNPV